MMQWQAETDAPRHEKAYQLWHHCQVWAGLDGIDLKVQALQFVPMVSQEVFNLKHTKESNH